MPSRKAASLNKFNVEGVITASILFIPDSASGTAIRFRSTAYVSEQKTCLTTALENQGFWSKDEQLGCFPQQDVAAICNGISAQVRLVGGGSKKGALEVEVLIDRKDRKQNELEMSLQQTSLILACPQDQDFF